MDSGRGSRSKRGYSDPLGDLLENLKQNPIAGLFTSPATDNSVLLDDWWLVRSNVECGSKRVAVAGYIAKNYNEFPFTSAPIITRHDTFTLEAADGMTVKIEGMINRTNTQNNGFSHEVCQHFNIGFPFFWKKYIDSCLDITPTHGTSTSQILEQVVNGTREILNHNSEAADPIRINYETWETSPGSSTKEVEPQHENGLISKDGKDAEESATPEKGDTVRETKLPTTGKRKNAVAESKVSGGKGSSKKDHVPQSTLKTTRRGRSHTNMEVRGVTISSSQSESSIRRSRSGRAIIPTIDKGSQTVVYDQNGNFAGIVSPISVTKGSTSKPSQKKRRF